MRTIKLGPQQIRAGFKPETFNEKDNTVEVVWSTGAAVKRYPWFGEPYIEELSMKKAHIRMDRLNNGAPVLNNHNSWGLNDIIGVVEKASIKDNEGLATVRLSDREDIRGIVNDIKNGIIRNISVGYSIHKMEELKTKSEDGFPIYRAVDWEPMELSFVGIPADAGAQARSQQNEKLTECVVITTQEQQSEDEMKTKGQRSEEITEPAPVVSSEETSQKPEGDASEPVGEPVASEEPKGEEPIAETEEVSEKEKEEVGQPVDPEAVRNAEISRQKEIRTAVRVANLPENFADKLVENVRLTTEEARKLIFEELEKRSESVKTNNQTKIEVTNMEQRELRRNAAVRGLLHRFDNAKYKLEQGDAEFRQGSIVDLARKVLSLEGHRDAYDVSKSEVARRSLHSSSDFPLILGNVANKVLRDAYEGAPSTFTPFVTVRTASDFKEITSLQLSNGGQLSKINEHGEYKRTTLNENAEKYKIEKFGLILGRTYELIVNDDLDAFTRIPSRLGIRAREKENQVFWDLFIANQVMAETGLGLFNASHNNLAGAGAAISVDSIGAGRAAMRKQIDLDGELMNLAPSYLIVPAALETKAEQFVASVTAAQSSNVNPFSGRLIPVTEARLDANSALSWYLAADKARTDLAEMSYLDGQGPEIFTREGFEIDGMEVKIRHHFGMKFVDYRGFYKNPGA